MVFGAIINWTVGKTLDLTFDTIWWITKKTGQGIFYAGQYLIIRKNNNHNNNNNNNNLEKELELELENLNNKKSDELILLIKEQNKLLAEEIRILKEKEEKEEKE
jgi:hypothetical protein